MVLYNLNMFSPESVPCDSGDIYIYAAPLLEGSSCIVCVCVLVLVLVLPASRVFLGTHPPPRGVSVFWCRRNPPLEMKGFRFSTPQTVRSLALALALVVVVVALFHDR